MGLDANKSLRTKVESQLGKTIKITRFNRNDGYS